MAARTCTKREKALVNKNKFIKLKVSVSTIVRTTKLLKLHERKGYHLKKCFKQS